VKYIVEREDGRRGWQIRGDDGLLFAADIPYRDDATRIVDALNAMVGLLAVVREMVTNTRPARDMFGVVRQCTSPEAIEVAEAALAKWGE